MEYGSTEDLIAIQPYEPNWKENNLVTFINRYYQYAHNWKIALHFLKLPDKLLFRTTFQKSGS